MCVLVSQTNRTEASLLGRVSPIRAHNLASMGSDRSELLYPHNKEWIGGEKERAGTMLDDSCEGSATTLCGSSRMEKNRPRTSGGSVTGRRIVSRRDAVHNRLLSSSYETQNRLRPI